MAHPIAQFPLDSNGTAKKKWKDANTTGLINEHLDLA